MNTVFLILLIALLVIHLCTYVLFVTREDFKCYVFTFLSGLIIMALSIASTILVSNAAFISFAVIVFLGRLTKQYKLALRVVSLVRRAEYLRDKNPKSPAEYKMYKDLKAELWSKRRIEV